MEASQWRGFREEWGKGTRNKKHKWYGPNRQREVKNIMGNNNPKNLYV